MMIMAINKDSIHLLLNKSETGLYKLYLNNEPHSAYLHLDDAIKAFNELALLLEHD